MPKIELKKGERPIGRQKGTPNRITTQLKEMVIEALEDVGGVTYLTEQAQKNPVAFLSLLGKVLPLQLRHSGDQDNPVVFQPTITPAVAELLDKIKCANVQN